MPSKWVEHVKNYASKNNMKYGEAMGNAQCKREYHESKGAEMVEGGKFRLGKTLKKINTKVKDAVVSKEQFYSGCDMKKSMIANNPTVFNKIAEKYKTATSLTMRHFLK